MKIWSAAVRATALISEGSASFATLIGQALAVIVVAASFTQIAIIVFVLPRWGVWLEVAGALIAFAGALLVVPELVDSARRSLARSSSPSAAWSLSRFSHRRCVRPPPARSLRLLGRSGIFCRQRSSAFL
jgi:hypothetical protein